MSDRTESVSVPQAESISALLVKLPWWAAASPTEQSKVSTALAELVAGGDDLADVAEMIGGYESAAAYIADIGLEAEEPKAEQAAAPTADTPIIVVKPEEVEQSEREVAEEVAKAAVKAIVRGERVLLKGHIEGGRLADEYLHRRMVIGNAKGAARAERAAGVTRLEGDLAKWTTNVDVNRTIGLYHANRLLAAGLEKQAERLPMSQFRDGWVRLIERTSKDTVEEQWVLLPGLEQDCKDAFAKGVEEAWSFATVSGAVKTLLATYAERQEAERKAKAEAAKTQLAKAEADRKAQQQQTQQAATDAKVAASAATEAQGDEKATLVANAEAAKAKLVEQQKAEQDRMAAEITQRQAVARSEAEAKAAAKESEKAKLAAKTTEERKAEADLRKAEKEAAKLMEQQECRAPIAKLSDMAKKGNAKDVAEMALELVESNDEPDTVVEELIRLLLASKHTSNPVKRALNAAAILMNPNTTSPAELAAALVSKSRNGTHQAALAS
jgi:hypothetical protein